MANQAVLLVRVPISPRLASARLKRATVNLTVILIYGPKLDTEEPAKHAVYDDFQDTTDSANSGDMMIIAGSWNARPGPADMATRRILGMFIMGSRYANGDRLVNFTPVNTFCFQHSLPTPATPPSDMVLLRLTHQEPDRPHASTAPMGFPYDQLPGREQARIMSRLVLAYAYF